MGIEQEIMKKNVEHQSVFSVIALSLIAGEAKNLPPHSVLGSGRNTFCAIRLDREEVYRTATVEKSLE